MLVYQEMKINNKKVIKLTNIYFMIVDMDQLLALIYVIKIFIYI